MAAPIPPVLVTVSDPGAAATLIELLGEDYGGVLAPGEGGSAMVVVTPIDEQRRSVVLYRVIQASRSVVDRHPEATLYLLTEDGSRWRLPPPTL
jgi:hypothetical protein